MYVHYMTDQTFVLETRGCLVPYRTTPHLTYDTPHKAEQLFGSLLDCGSHMRMQCKYTSVAALLCATVLWRRHSLRGWEWPETKWPPSLYRSIVLYSDSSANVLMHSLDVTPIYLFLARNSYLIFVPRMETTDVSSSVMFVTSHVFALFACLVFLSM
jgi:hypothetical protein